MRAYYNENEPFAAQWLRNLKDAGLIPQGDVDDRDINLVQPDDLRGYTQCHFSAGIAGWSLALQLAGWPDDREVWTGSCPCQPFSSAGKQLGFDDPRHLWPVWHRLIRERRPATIFGEQVARAHQWLALVRSDLEALAYAVGAMPIQAASVGAPHLRDRYWFVADANNKGEHDGAIDAEVALAPEPVADAESGTPRSRDHVRARQPDLGIGGQTLAHPDRLRLQIGGDDACSSSSARRASERREVVQHSGWAVEPDVGRLAHGVPARMGKLRAFGNAIVPAAGAAFITAFLECRP